MTDQPMISRLRPEPGTAAAPRLEDTQRGPSFLIEIPGSDGQMLLRMFERNGRLAMEYDPNHLEPAALALVHEMMRWSGVVGIRWKDEAVRAAGR